MVSSSLSLLPETPMRGRKESRKVGYFTTHRLSYSDRQQELETRRYITRWRLEPSDEAAYLRGELTSPKKPITFYIDPATPKQLRHYIRKGILDWNTAFEQAGFKDAVRVEEYTDSMAAEGDDLKYSLFTYAASTSPMPWDRRSSTRVQAKSSKPTSSGGTTSYLYCANGLLYRPVPSIQPYGIRNCPTA